jgi:hypothetical protein
MMDAYMLFMYESLVVSLLRENVRGSLLHSAPLRMGVKISKLTSEVCKK